MIATAHPKFMLELQRQAHENGTTIDLSSLHVTSLPRESVEYISSRVARLVLSGNLLSGLPSSFQELDHLQYLYLHGNQIRVFPQVLCSLKGLQVLDLSRNKLRELPNDFGSLTLSLKALSLSQNRLKRVPTCIAQMDALTILEVEDNPITFPPKEVLDFSGAPEDMGVWLDGVKEYLSTHGNINPSNPMREESESAVSEDDGGGGALLDDQDRHEKPSTQLPFIRARSFDISPRDATASKLTPPPPPVPSKSNDRVNGSSGRLRQPGSASVMERSRSNIEVMRRDANNILSGKSPKPEIAALSNDLLRANKHHSRGFSHDSGMTHEVISGDLQIESITPTSDSVQSMEKYFRRRSLLPVTAKSRSPAMSQKVLEASRGLLFAFSQVHTGIRQYIQTCADSALMASISRVLYNANAHIGELVDALEIHDGKLIHDVVHVVQACHACAGAFKHVTNMVLKHIEQLASKADVRFTRTFLLFLYGASMEIHNSWQTIQSLLPNAVFPQSSHSNPLSSRSSNFSVSTPVGQGPPSFFSSPSPARENVTYAARPETDTSGTPLGPETESADSQLFEKTRIATTAALSVLNLLSDAVAKNSGVEGHNEINVSISAAAQSKLRELASLTVSASDVTRRLQSTIQSKPFQSDTNNNCEHRRFWEDANAFVKSVISIAELTKTVSKDFDFKFSSSIPSALAATTRSTKEVAILLSVSSFRTMADSTNNPSAPPSLSSHQQQQQLHATQSGTHLASNPTSPISNPSLASPLMTSLTLTPALHNIQGTSRSISSPSSSQGGSFVASSELATANADHDNAISILKERERDKSDGDMKSPPVVSIPLQ